MGSPKSATIQIARILITDIPEELQKAVATTLRPLDELDKCRVDDWQTVNDLRGEEEDVLRSRVANIAFCLDFAELCFLTHYFS